MKYGLIIFSNTDNLGDDIQSYAAKQYLPHVDYLIEREKLNQFISNDNCMVSVIFAGWFLYMHLNWPPSPYIYPLNISMHFDTYYSRYLDNPLEKNGVLEGYGAKWLNDNGPVGARDYFTLNLLNGFDINTYFSGCITLTLKRFHGISKHNAIIAVDISQTLIDKIRGSCNKEIIIKTHKIKLNSYSAAERFNLVEEYLQLYQGAALVITSRLHAALPCLALGTPVLFIKDIKFFNRIGTYMPYLHSAFERDILNESYVYDFNNPVDNPTDYHLIRNPLEKACVNFVKQCERMSDMYVTSEAIQKDIDARKQHLQIFNKKTQP